MIKFIVPALCLALSLGAPVGAQTYNTGCAIHKGNELRCAQHLPLHGEYSGNVTLSVSGNGQMSGDVQLWSSVCGLPGQAQGVRRISNTNSQLNFTNRGVGGALTGACIEIYIFNCRDQAQQPVSCHGGFGTTQMQTYYSTMR